MPIKRTSPSRTEPTPVPASRSLARRQRERDEARTKLLDAARRLFAEHGPDHVSMRQVADAAEYTAGTIYLHFRDKDALFQELVSADFDAHAEAFRRLGDVADPVDRLRQASRIYGDFAERYPYHYRLLFMTAGSGQARRAFARDHPGDHPGGRHAAGDGPSDVGHTAAGGNGFDVIRSAAAEAIALGHLRPTDPFAVARALWATVHGVVSLHLVQLNPALADARPLSGQIAFAVDAVLDGFAGDAVGPTTGRRSAAKPRGRSAR